MDSKRESRLFLLIGVSAGMALAVAVFLIVPRFQEMFVAFGAKLPLATELLLATFRWSGIVPVITFALWALWPNPSKKGIAALFFGTVSAVVLFLFVFFALYAPIFQLAAVEL